LPRRGRVDNLAFGREEDFATSNDDRARLSGSWPCLGGRVSAADWLGGTGAPVVEALEPESAGSRRSAEGIGPPGYQL